MRGSRRGWRLGLPLLVVLVAVAGAFAIGRSGDEKRPDPAPAAPNIVAIVTDDQNLDQFNRKTMPATTRLLADRGTTFTDYVVTTPLCCPSRATYLTGQYIHNNGVTSNTYKKLEDKGNVLPVWLQRAGYRTAHVGKFLNNYAKDLDDPADSTPGWDQWFTQLEPQRYFDYELSENGEVVAYGSDPEDYLTRVLNRHAVDVIEKYAREDETFYLQVDYFAPHFGAGRDPNPCKGAAAPDPDDEPFLSRPEAALSAKPSTNEREVADKPWFIREQQPIGKAERRTIDQHHRCAVASMRAVDRGVEQIVEALERTGELDRTVLVFTSDNGYFYGEHRIRSRKEFPYEEIVHMPLVIRMPASLRGAEAVAKVDAPVANIDLAPTLLDLARAKPCAGGGKCRTLDGRSLVPLLRDANAPWPKERALLIELDQSPKKPKPYPRPCSYAGVRVDGKVLIHHFSAARAKGSCEETDEVEFYDLRADPHQLENLARSGSNGHLRERAALAERLERLRKCAGAAGEGEPEPVSGRPACE